MFLQANCIDSTAEPTKVFAGEIKKLQADKLKPQEQITLEPYERDHAVVVGVYRYVFVSGLVLVHFEMSLLFFQYLQTSEESQVILNNYVPFVIIFVIL